jgi:hypothetical protein
MPSKRPAHNLHFTEDNTYFELNVSVSHNIPKNNKNKRTPS